MIKKFMSSDILKFKPKLPNGETVNVSFLIKIIKFGGIWPIGSNVSKAVRYLYNFQGAILLLSVYVTASEEILFSIKNFKEFTDITEAFVTLLPAIHHAPIMTLLLFQRRELTKELLIKLYQKVYVTKTENLEAYKIVQRELRAIRLFTMSYFPILVLFLGRPFVLILLNYLNYDGHDNNRIYPYKLTPFYDDSNTFVYAISLTYNCLAGILVIFYVIFSDNILGTTISHIYGRLIIIQNEIMNLYEDSMESKRKYGTNIHKYFDKKINELIVKIDDVYGFCKLTQYYFSIIYLFHIVFASLFCCILALQMANYGFTLATLKYLIWLVSSIIEILIFGQLGSNLIEKSEKIAEAFYICNWEKILKYGTAQDNIKLMRKLTIAMQRIQKPVEITGMGFVKLSLPSSAKAISTSISYFMFLKKLNSSQKN